MITETFETFEQATSRAKLVSVRLGTNVSLARCKDSWQISFESDQGYESELGDEEEDDYDHGAEWLALQESEKRRKEEENEEEEEEDEGEYDLAVKDRIEDFDKWADFVQEGGEEEPY